MALLTVRLNVRFFFLFYGDPRLKKKTDLQPDTATSVSQDTVFSAVREDTDKSPHQKDLGCEHHIQIMPRARAESCSWKVVIPTQKAAPVHGQLIEVDKPAVNASEKAGVGPIDGTSTSCEGDSNLDLPTQAIPDCGASARTTEADERSFDRTWTEESRGGGEVSSLSRPDQSLACPASPSCHTASAPANLNVHLEPQRTASNELNDPLPQVEQNASLDVCAEDDASSLVSEWDATRLDYDSYHREAGQGREVRKDGRARAGMTAIRQWEHCPLSHKSMGLGVCEPACSVSSPARRSDVTQSADDVGVESDVLSVEITGLQMSGFTLDQAIARGEHEERGGEEDMGHAPRSLSPASSEEGEGQSVSRAAVQAARISATTRSPAEVLLPRENRPAEKNGARDLVTVVADAGVPARVSALRTPTLEMEAEEDTDDVDEYEDYFSQENGEAEQAECERNEVGANVQIVPLEVSLEFSNCPLLLSPIFPASDTGARTRAATSDCLSMSRSFSSRKFGTPVALNTSGYPFWEDEMREKGICIKDLQE